MSRRTDEPDEYKPTQTPQRDDGVEANSEANRLNRCSMYSKKVYIVRDLRCNYGTKKKHLLY